MSTVGLVASGLDANGNPVYSGGGSELLSPAIDINGRAIASVISNTGELVGVTEFETGAAEIILNETAVAQFEVLGAAITSDGTPMPVTVAFGIGSEQREPFGAFTSPSDGNVNDGVRGRRFTTEELDAGTSLSVFGTSWETSGDEYMTVTSTANTPQVTVLRDGEMPPNMEGFDGQDSAEEFVADFLDPVTGAVSIEQNQAIFLFELGTTDLDSAAADFQDLVVLVTFARDTTELNGGPSDACAFYDDTAAVTGDDSTGGVTSADSFGQWFSDSSASTSEADSFEMGWNSSVGAYEYTSSSFGLVQGLGGAGFTYEASGIFSYSECGGQFIEVEADADVWLFVDGQLVAEIAGHALGSQRVDIDRLGLDAGVGHEFKLFYAQRDASSDDFTLRTNIQFASPAEMIFPSGGGWD